jgi:hypothetical protein
MNIFHIHYAQASQEHGSFTWSRCRCGARRVRQNVIQDSGWKWRPWWPVDTTADPGRNNA